MKKTRLFLLAAALLTPMLLGACATPATSLDSAYSSGGVFSTAPYTRTIFSSSNF